MENSHQKLSKNFKTNKIISTKSLSFHLTGYSFIIRTTRGHIRHKFINISSKFEWRTNEYAPHIHKSIIMTTFFLHFLSSKTLTQQVFFAFILVFLAFSLEMQILSEQNWESGKFLSRSFSLSFFHKIQEKSLWNVYCWILAMKKRSVQKYQSNKMSNDR